MHVEQTPDGLVVDRSWITRMYGLSDRWARKELPVHGYERGGKALHLITPEVALRLSTTRSRRRSSRRDTRGDLGGP